MASRERVSRLTTSDLARLLDRADDPQLAIERLIGDLEEGIVDLRREMVSAVAHQNRVRRQYFAAEEAAGGIEREASLALARGEERRARHVLARRIGALVARDRLETELAEAGQVSAELVATLIRMEDRAQLVRRKQDELARQSRVPGAASRPVELNPSRPRPAEQNRTHAFDGFAEAVDVLGQEASRSGGEGAEGGGRC
jgi:phage shock protein A